MEAAIPPTTTTTHSDIGEDTFGVVSVDDKTHNFGHVTLVGDGDDDDDSKVLRQKIKVDTSQLLEYANNRKKKLLKKATAASVDQDLSKEGMKELVVTINEEVKDLMKKKIKSLKKGRGGSSEGGKGEDTYDPFPRLQYSQRGGSQSDVLLGSSSSGGTTSMRPTKPSVPPSTSASSSSAGSKRRQSKKVPSQLNLKAGIRTIEENR